MVTVKCVDCFKVLSVKSRFKIFDYLKNHTKKVTVNELVKMTKLRQPTVTFHVNQLTKLGLVNKEKKGREVYCQLSEGCDPSCVLFS